MEASMNCNNQRRVFKSTLSALREHLTRWFNLLKNGQDSTDLTILAQGEEIPCHQTVLGISSGYFFKLFSKTVWQQNTMVVYDTHSPEIVKLALYFMYNGCVNVEGRDLEDFIAAAKHLEIRGIYRDGFLEPSEEPTQTSPSSESAPSNDEGRSPEYISSLKDMFAPVMGPELHDEQPPTTLSSPSVQNKYTSAIGTVKRRKQRAPSFKKVQAGTLTKATKARRQTSPRPIAKDVNTKKKYKNYSKETLQMAIDAVKKDGKKPGQAAAEYCIPIRTLYDKLKKKKNST